eukprot:Rmarinus@m.7424
MGIVASTRAHLKRKELKTLSDTTNFTLDEIKALYKHFQDISSAEVDDGVIDKAEFQKSLGLRDGLFVDRMFGLFDANGDQEINFREFIVGLSVFCPRAEVKDKMKFSFQVYDFDGDGYITKEELKQMLEATLVENNLSLTGQQVDDLVTATFQEADTDGDGTISFEEYCAMVEKHPTMIQNMTIHSISSSGTNASADS